MNEKVEKTAEQLAAEATAAAQVKADEKAAKAKVAAEAKAAKAEASAKAKADKVAASAKAKLDKAQAKVDAKVAAKLAKESNKMPEQNGVRRPKPETLCGKAWTIFDNVSEKTGVPATIGDSMAIAKAANMNEGNVRAEYARWRKFHGITGRLSAPAPAAPPAAPAAE